jgi:hypothetical protein
MKCRLFFFSISVIVILCGCSNRKQAKPVRQLWHETIDLGNEYLGYGGFLAYCQGVVVGIEMNRSLQPFFCLEPGDSSDTFFFFGNKGRGPNEFLMPYSIQCIDDRTVGVFDTQTRLYSEFAVPGQRETLKVGKGVKMPFPSTRIIRTAFDQYIGLTSLDEKMFSLADSTGAAVDTFFEYPYRDDAERKDLARGMAYQGTLAVNPSKTRFVYSSFYGEIIHFYSIEENNIQLINKIENKYPVYRQNDNGTRGVSYDGNGTDGYIATYATDQFVYALYSGGTILERHEKKSSNYEGNILRVFDWSGVLVKEYALDVPCSYLCVSDDDSTMWAIATLPDEIALVSFRFENETEIKDEPELKVSTIPVGRPSVPAGKMRYGIEVRTKDGRQNDETRKVLDSIKNLPANITLDLRPTDRYDVQTNVDTVNNVMNTVLILK